MNFLHISRIIRMGLSNFTRNLKLSIASIMMMIVTLVMLSTLSFLFFVTRGSLTAIQSRVDMSVYFNLGVSEAKIKLLQSELDQNTKVASTSYISTAEALQKFRDSNANDPLILQSLAQLPDNPLPASLQVKAVSLDDYPILADYLKQDDKKDLVASVNYEDNQELISRLSALLRLLVIGGSTILIVFALIAILVCINTVTLVIYNRKEEVEIMRLVGATNWYIRGPFLIESAIASLAATIVSSGLLIPVYIWSLPQLARYLGPASAMLSRDPLMIIALIASQFAIAFLISTFASLFAIRKYLRT